MNDTKQRNNTLPGPKPSLWITIRTFVKENPHVWLALLLPVYLALFFLVEWYVSPDKPYWSSYLPLDDKIPFCEWFALPYVMWYPFLVIPGLIFLLKDGEAFRKYMLYIGLGFSSAVIFCLLFPNGQDLRPAAFPRENFCTEILRWIYSADTNTNVCPSMHVIGCAALTLACFDSEPLRRRHLQWVMLPLGLVISMSTVFVKQHSILDVFVAIPVCVILYFIIYHRAFVKKFGKAANRDA